MNDYRAVIPDFSSVIPAKAGIQKAADTRSRAALAISPKIPLAPAPA